MLITEQLLFDLGAEKVGDVICLISEGYEFYFDQKDGNAWWNFRCGRGGFIHSVTHLRECFGMIADDFSEAGKDELKMELRTLLGVEE